MTFDDLDDDAVIRGAALMTSQRLARYHAVAGTNRGALELHAHAMQVAGSMLAAIGVVEIALRNTTSEKIATLAGRPNWIQNPPSSLEWRPAEGRSIKKAIKDAKRSLYASLSHRDKMALDVTAFPFGIPPGLSHDDRVKARQAQIQAPEGQVVAQLTFGFWKGLYSEDYETALWQRSLRTIFPRKSLKRADVARHLETIYQTRNRIAHHESVAGPRVGALKAAIAFIACNMHSRDENPASPLGKLLAPHIALVDDHAAAFEMCLSRFIPARLES